MPIPLRPNSQQSNYQFDASFLANMPSEEKKVITASDRDAGLLMKIWNGAVKTGEYQFNITDNVISQRDFSILKANGFIMGDMRGCEFTARAKKIVTVMTLGEDNAFLKKRVDKSYSEILASNNKSMKTGYRIPKHASGKMIKQCKVKMNGGSVILTYDEWMAMGEKMGWDK